MNTILKKIAAGLAFIIGAMAVFAGGRVLLGNDPGYYVINWLPLYNYSIGLITLTTTAVLIWTSSKYAMTVAIGTFSLHALVMLILQTAYRGVVAADSLEAMTIRLVVWAVILGLMAFPVRSKTNQAAAQS